MAANPQRPILYFQRSWVKSWLRLLPAQVEQIIFYAQWPINKRRNRCLLSLHCVSMEQILAKRSPRPVWVKGGIVLAFWEKTALGSRSRLDEYGVARKRAPPQSTLLDKSHAYNQNRPLAPIATVINPSVRFTATIRRITPSCTPASAQFAKATARRRRRHGTK